MGWEGARWRMGLVAWRTEQLGAGLGLQRLPPGIGHYARATRLVSLPMMSGLAPIPLPWNTCSNPALLYSLEYVT